MWSSRRGRPRLAHPRGVQSPVRALPRSVSRGPRVGARSPPPRARRLRRLLRRVPPARRVQRAGLLPPCGRGPVPPARPCPREHPSRGDGSALQCRGGPNPPDHPAGRARPDPDEHRTAGGRRQSRVQRRRRDRIRRRRDPRLAQGPVQVGLRQRDVASSVLVSLAGSGDGSPNFWLDPKNGVNYRVVVQTPQYRIDSVDALAREPLLATTAGGGPQLLTNLATVDPGTTPAVANHYNVQRVFDVFASVQDRDLGGAARDIGKVVADERRHLPRGSTLTVRGQVQSMNSAFLGLGGGMIFAVVLVYALMVVNFQSWLDPFIIITALPGAIAGVLWALFVTQMTVNVPSLMGAIMSIGVATANSILVVTFANDDRQAGHDAASAALSAGGTRLRPVLMNALAMIIGMFPIALGLGEGGEQNAPLGRAAIRGLVLAPVVTLFVVPVFYSLFRGRAPHVEEEADPS